MFAVFTLENSTEKEKAQSLEIPQKASLENSLTTDGLLEISFLF